MLHEGVQRLPPKGLGELLGAHWPVTGLQLMKDSLQGQGHTLGGVVALSWHLVHSLGNEVVVVVYYMFFFAFCLLRGKEIVVVIMFSEMLCSLTTTILSLRPQTDWWGFEECLYSLWCRNLVTLPLQLQKCRENMELISIKAF